MVSRTLGIALLISLAAHIFGMTAVTIITPENMRMRGAYTRVDFLGPILRKTAFDIMLENTEPLMSTTYTHSPLSMRNRYLDVVVAKRKSAAREFPEYLDDNMDVFVLGFLTGSKTVPDIKLDFGGTPSVFSGWGPNINVPTGTRKVIYRPVPPLIMRDLYGGERSFRVKVKVQIGRDGNVKYAEPLTTTGYPQLDMTASKYAKGWIFEPKESANVPDEWQVVEVILNTGRDQ
ncbi:energy transducer TonB [Candidatus Omnitrophota bacterium]